MQNTEYPSNLTDAEWEILRPLLPPRAKRGRPLTSRRRVINGILYLLRAGCAWRMLPREFGPWSTIYAIYRRWVKSDLWQKLHDQLRTRVRQADGRQPAPTAAVLDSQTVKVASQGGPCGYDAGKKTSGRKRHILVDMLGLLLGGLGRPGQRTGSGRRQNPAAVVHLQLRPSGQDLGGWGLRRSLGRLGQSLAPPGSAPPGHRASQSHRARIPCPAQALVGRTHVRVVRQTWMRTALSEVPSKALMRKCCLIH